ncbi:MAG: hypothetical protein ABII82_14410, partial [Verrucomicrobiota bacterium]
LAAAATFESAFRQTRKGISIVSGSDTILSLSHTSNTGFDSEPRAELVEDHGLTRIYDVTIAFGLPADYSDLAGRRTSRVDVDLSDAARKTVTVTGEYTAVGADDATDVYADAVATLCANVLAGLGGSYNLVKETYDYQETDKELRFARHYEQSLVALASAQLKTQELRISATHVNPGNSMTLSGERPMQLSAWTANYTAAVDVDQTTGATALWTLWDGTILPWIVNQVSTSGGERVVVTSADASLDATGNHIIATVTLAGCQSSGPLEWTVTDTISINPGAIVLPIHSPHPLANFLSYGPARVTRTLTEDGTWIGAAADERPWAPRPEMILEGIGERSTVHVRGEAIDVLWVPFPHVDSVTPIDVGLPQFGQIRVWRIHREYPFVGLCEDASIVRPATLNDT